MPRGLPMKFSSVVGHERVAEVLRRAADTGRVAPTVMFHGREGVGKRTMAMAFVSYLICQDRRDGDSCGVCPNCRRIDDGGYVDLVVLQPEKGVIKIDDIREAMPRLMYEPVIGPWKCLIIDDAHTMNTEAANAALKTLEEPPRNTVFILVTSSPDTMPRTVLSRSFQVPFGPVPTAAIADLLERVRGVDADTARSAAALSSGCPGGAFSMLDSTALAERRDFIRTFLSLAREPARTRLQFSEGVPMDRDGADAYRVILESVARDLLLAVSGASAAEMCNSDMAAEIFDFADRAGPDRVVAIADAWLDWDMARAYNPMPRSAIDRMVLNMPRRQA
jgi:DNA polymerase III delta' subunit